MRITKIESQKKNPGRKNIFANEEFIAGVSDETLLRAGLRTGDEVTDERLKALIQEEETVGAKRVALRFLARRPRTAKEIRNKLRENEFGETDINRTIESLEQSGLINDTEFAKMYIRDALSLKPTGRNLLKRKLLLLGIERAIVDQVSQETFADVDDHAAAMEAGRKFLKKSTATRKTSDVQLRNRLASFLSRRGFTWETIVPVMKALTKEKDE